MSSGFRPSEEPNKNFSIVGRWGSMIRPELPSDITFGHAAKPHPAVVRKGSAAR